MSAWSTEVRRARAAAEAADWAQRFDAGQLSALERAELVDWLRESPVHVAEMLRIGRLTSALAAFDGWGRVQPAGELFQNNVADLALRQGTPPPRRARTTRGQWLAGMAAALACFAVSVALLHQQPSETLLHTQAGERHEMTLSDGSIVRLSPGTDLRIRFQPHLRSVVLERGETVFRVAKDQARPFVVVAAGARIQAVGTVFSVGRNAETVVVTVSEGRVIVTPDAAAPDHPARSQGFPSILLQANERVSVSARGFVSPVRRVESTRLLEWGDNQLVFENTSIAEVVSRFNRRNHVQIRITDDALASRTVSGVFDANDPRSFVDFLQAVVGATSVDDGHDEIFVTPLAAGEGPAVPRR